MNSWRLRRGARLAEVLAWCWQEHSVDRLLVSARLDSSRKQRVLSRPSIEGVIESIFGARVLEKRFASRWPGTQLIGHQGAVYIIEFDDSLIKPMATAGKLFFDWTQNHEPPLPEDLCLFRKGADWPALVSVTHEWDAWVFSEEAPTFCRRESRNFNSIIPMVPDSQNDFVGN
jgi:hypothetical protein